MNSKSKIFLFLMLAFLAGVAFGTFFELGISLIFLIPALTGIFLLVFRNRVATLSFFVFLCFTFGVLHYQADDIFHLSYSNLKPGSIEIVGMVTEQPSFKNGSQRFVIESLEKEKILLVVKKFPEYEYGDIIKAKGKLEKPKNFSDFDYSSYLAKDDIYFLMKDPFIVLEKRGGGSFVKRKLFSLKDAFEKNINSSLPSPEADLLNGMLFGSKSKIPNDLYENFKKTGTAHIVALSGFNITVIVIFLAWIFGHFSQNAKLVAVSTIAVVFLFVIMTGASSSVMRAALMGIVLLLARYYGRAKHSLNALIFAAVLMVALNPKILIFDISFQLSFIAAMGILYIYPFFLRKFDKIPNVLKLKDTLATTLAAQTAVLPIVLYNFKQISLIAPVANVLIVPVVPLVMLSGFLIGLAGFILFPLAKIFSFFAWFMLAYQINIIEFFGSLPFASLSF